MSASESSLVNGRVLLTGGSGFIGQNLWEYYTRTGARVLNLDVRRPPAPQAEADWRRCDLLDLATLRSAVREFQPDLVLHMGARTDLAGNSIDDYRVNTLGVQNLLEAMEEEAGIRRVLFCSTMLVCRLGYQPSQDTDFCPSTPYGASKAEGEQIVRRAAPLRYSWAIVRPTSIWGPWFGSPYRSFFEMLERGLYVHPRGHYPQRTYGFVGNAVAQIAAIASASSTDVQGRVFYLGDYEPINVKSWGDAIRRARGRAPVRELPYTVFRAAALAGDVLKRFGISNPPMSSFRLSNLRTPAVYDLSATQKLCPALPFDRKQAIAATLAWLDQDRTATN